MTGPAPPVDPAALVESEEPAPLAGFTVGVTAARRADELAVMLERRGAVVVRAPAIRLVPLADDSELRRVTRLCLDDPPDIVVATTGVGFRGWMSAAEGWGLGERLVATLRGARLLARGPKARGAFRAAGLPDAWSPESESSAGVLDHLLEHPVDGLRIAVQLHGEPLPDFVDALRCAGADVVEVPVYGWTAPEDTTPLTKLVAATCAGEVDAVTFTSAPAAASMLATADRGGRGPELEQAFRERVVAACVGSVCSGPLNNRDVPALVPHRFRLGNLVRLLADELPRRARRLPVAGHDLQLRGHAVVVDGELRPVSRNGMLLLAELARHPGRVIGRAELVAALCQNDDGATDRAAPDEHAVESAIARLRTALGAPGLVQTVIRRGYRLALEPTNGDAPCVDEEPDQ